MSASMLRLPSFRHRAVLRSRPKVLRQLDEDVVVERDVLSSVWRLTAQAAMLSCLMAGGAGRTD